MRLLPFSLLLLSFPAAAQVPQTNATAESPVVGLSVTEFVESAPDLALFDVGVSSTATTATAAIAENARKMENIIARVRSAGVAARDVQTTGISLYPQQSNPVRLANGTYSAQRIVGYQASNNVRVRYRRLGEVGALIDALVAAGANNVQGPQFTVEDPAARLVLARDKALVTAAERANYYAGKAGARGIRLLSVTESAQGGYYGRERGMMAQATNMSAPEAAPPSPVEPGQVTSAVTLFVQYALVR